MTSNPFGIYNMTSCFELDSMANAFLFLWMDDPKKHQYQENVDNILNIFVTTQVQWFTIQGSRLKRG